VRLTVIHAWLDDGVPRHEFYPVLGVEAVVVDEDDPELSHRPLILVDGEVVTVKDARRFCFGDDSLTQTVECPWPASEDRAQLADAVERLKTLLRRRKLARDGKP
jgi:hypothetical protein